MPVKIRKATQHMAMFSVDADAAQQLIDYSGLQVCRPLPGRAIVDADTDALHRRRSRRVPRIQHQRDGQPARVRARTALAVGASFTTCSSTRPSLWKPDGRFGAFRRSCPTSPSVTGSSSVSTRASTANSWSAWNSVPASRFRRRSRHARAGVARVLASRRPDTRNAAMRSRSTVRATGRAGHSVRLGEHPYAKELASLGFPKRALVSSSAANVEMSFGDAQEVRQ